MVDLYKYTVKFKLNGIDKDGTLEQVTEGIFSLVLHRNLNNPASFPPAPPLTSINHS